jgi:hypothetical protein
MLETEHRVQRYRAFFARFDLLTGRPYSGMFTVVKT